MATPVELENLLVRLTGDGSGYRDMLQQAAKQTQDATVRIGSSSKVIEGFGLRIRAFAGSVGGFMQTVVPMLGVAGGIGGVFQAVQEAASSEALETSFEFLVGSAEKAQKALADLRQFADVTPFETTEVVEAAKQMLAFGTNAEDIVPTMRTLGDVSSALNIPLGQLSYLFGTLKSQGRAFTVDINQFAMRGIPIWQQLEQQFGKTNTEMRKMVEQGKVGFEDVEKAFKATSGPMSKFTGGMERQATTLTGLYSTLKSEVSNSLREIGKVLVEEVNLKQFVKDTGSVLKFLVDTFKAIPADVKRFVVALGGGAVIVASIVAGFLVLSTVFSVVAAALSPFTVILGSVVALTALWVKHVGGVGAAWEIVKQRATEFWEFTHTIRQALESLANSIIEVLAPVWEEIKGTLEVLWDDFVNSTNVNWTKIRDVILETILTAEFVVRNWGRVWDIVFLQAGSDLTTFALDFQDFFVRKVPIWLKFMLDNFTSIFTDIANFWKTVWTNMAANAVNVIKNLPALIKGEKQFGDLWTDLTDGFKSATKEFPKLGERALTPVEQAMRKVLVDMWANLDADRKKFIEGKMKEFGMVPPEAGEEAAKGGEELGKKAAEGVIKELKKIDAAAFGSAEALARLDQYRTMLAQGKPPPPGFGQRMHAGIEKQGGFNFGRRMFEGIQTGMQKDKGGSEEGNGYLKEIRDLLKKDPLGPTVVLADSAIGME